MTGGGFIKLLQLQDQSQVIAVEGILSVSIEEETSNPNVIAILKNGSKVFLGCYYTDERARLAYESLKVWLSDNDNHSVFTMLGE